MRRTCALSSGRDSKPSNERQIFLRTCTLQPRTWKPPGATRTTASKCDHGRARRGYARQRWNDRVPGLSDHSPLGTATPYPSHNTDTLSLASTTKYKKTNACMNMCNNHAATSMCQAPSLQFMTPLPPTPLLELSVNARLSEMSPWGRFYSACYHSQNEGQWYMVASRCWDHISL